MGTSRPSIQEVQRPLILGVLAGVLFGCLLGTVFGTYYAWNVDPAVYQGGAHPNEWNPEYQSHYIATVVDSYNVNRNANLASERMKIFDASTQIRELGELSTAFVANGQAAEAQVVNDLATALKGVNSWDDTTIQNVVAQLSTEISSNDPDGRKAQGLNTFSADLLGAIPQPAQPSTNEGDAGGDTGAGTDTDQAPVDAAAPPAEPAQGGGTPLWQYCLCGLLLLLVIGAIVLLIGRRRFNQLRHQKPEVEWVGEGPAPLKVWSGTYEHKSEHNNYDEFFTIETHDGDFLGESGMGIMKAIVGTDPKQVTAFDVGLFDKTDITTLSRVVMSADAYHNDTELMTNIQNNPLAEAVLAEEGTEFSLDTSALRVVAKIEELAYGGDQSYFEKLKLSLNVFLQEGADLKIGTMDIPEQYQS